MIILIAIGIWLAAWLAAGIVVALLFALIAGGLNRTPALPPAVPARHPDEAVRLTIAEEQALAVLEGQFGSEGRTA